MKKFLTFILALCLSATSFAQTENDSTNVGATTKDTIQVWNWNVPSVLSNQWLKNDNIRVALMSPSIIDELVEMLSSNNLFGDSPQSLSVEERKRRALIILDFYKKEGYMAQDMTECATPNFASLITKEDLTSLKNNIPNLEKLAKELANNPKVSMEELNAAYPFATDSAYRHFVQAIKNAVYEDTVYVPALKEKFLAYADYRNYIDFSHNADFYNKGVIIFNSLNKHLKKIARRTISDSSLSRSYYSKDYVYNRIMSNLLRDMNWDEATQDTLYIKSQNIAEKENTIIQVLIEYSAGKILNRYDSSRNGIYENILTKNSEFYNTYLQILDTYLHDRYSTLKPNVRTYVYAIQCQKLIEKGITQETMQQLLEDLARIEPHIKDMNAAIDKYNGLSDQEVIESVERYSEKLNKYRATHPKIIAARTPKIAESEINEIDRIVDVPEKAASFPGGEEALRKFLKDHLKYPRSLNEMGIQGRVTTKLVVEEDGSISNIEIMRSPDKLFSEEAIRVIKSMPKWIPAKVGGRPERSHFILPITFTLG